MDINERLVKMNPKEFNELTGFSDQSEASCSKIIQGISKALKRANELRIKQAQNNDFQVKLDKMKDLLEDY